MKCIRTYCFKLYKSKKNRKLHKQINAAGLIYNHCIALHKRYYRLFKKQLNSNKLKTHLAKIKKIVQLSEQFCKKWKIVQLKKGPQMGS